MDFIKHYNKIRELRNKLCHAGDWNKNKDLKDLKMYIEEFFKLYKERYINNENMQEDLRVTVNGF